MFIYNSNESDKSIFSKIIKVLMVVIIAWQLIVQAYTFLGFHPDQTRLQDSERVPARSDGLHG